MRLKAYIVIFFLFFANCFSEVCRFPAPLTLSLQEAERIACEQNNDIMTLRQLLCRARGGRLESFSKWFPEVVLISQGFKTSKKDLFTETHSVFMSQFYVTQALFSTNKYYNVKISSLAVEQLSALLEAMVIDVLYEVRSVYYQIVFDQETIETAKKNIALFTELSEKEESRYEIGTSILLNVNQSQVAVAIATKAYYEAIKNWKIDKDHLATILGFDPGRVNLEVTAKKIPVEEVPKIREKLHYVRGIFGDKNAIFSPGFPFTQREAMADLFTAQEIGGWEWTALQYSPLLHSKATDVKIASQELCKRKGEYFPSVDLHANYGGTPSETTEFTSSNFTNQRFQWGIGLQVNWLLFDSLGREHRIRMAKRERCAKKYEYLKEVQLAYQAVRRQIFLIEESIANAVTAESNVKLAEQTLELAKNQLEIGYITIFDYETVVNNLIQAMNTKNEARFELIQGYYGLIHASGVDLIGCGL